MSKKSEKLGAYAVRRAGRGLVMTVPQDWADRLGVKPKDRLEVYEDDEGLRIKRGKE